VSVIVESHVEEIVSFLTNKGEATTAEIAEAIGLKPSRTRELLGVIDVGPEAVLSFLLYKSYVLYNLHLFLDFRLVFLFLMDYLLLYLFRLVFLADLLRLLPNLL
jgi:hypothetical protein